MQKSNCQQFAILIKFYNIFLIINLLSFYPSIQLHQFDNVVNVTIQQYEFNSSYRLQYNKSI